MKRKRIIAIALALVMCLPSIAFANSQTMNEYDALTSNDEANPVRVAISKNLQLPVGTPTPETVFSFEAKGISVDGDTSDMVVNNMPNLNVNMVIPFTSTDTGAPLESDADIISIVNESGNIFANIDFEKPGIYVYEITEVQATSNGIEDNAPYERVTFSKAVYTMSVYVTWNAARTGTYIYGVGTAVTVPDASGEQTINKKVDATPGGDGNRYRHSQMIFTNNYVKTNAPVDPDNPDPVNESTLFVKKEVTGNMGIFTQYFDFELTLTLPVIMEEKPNSYRAYIVEGNTVIDPTENAPSVLTATDGGGTFILVSTQGPTKFKLKDNQRLVFVDTPVGTRYTVSEDIAAGYIQTVQVTTNAISLGTISREEGLALSTGSQLIGDKLNSAVFTNNRESAAPMGIDMNNLPFIGLILLTIGALAGFVVVKSRRRKHVAEQVI